MEIDRFVFFWRGPFSQWAKYSFVIDGVTYVTCEQYMMAEKARLFKDGETEAKILATANPRKQKELGRQVKGFDQAAWDAVCVEVVYRGNLAKFSQNPELLELLLATGDKIIAEASPVDPIWGIGMAEDNPSVTDMSLWGKNLLGNVIMRIRETLLASA
jgi:ribA/ribD-fused uncharacterized protein